MRIFYIILISLVLLLALSILVSWGWAFLAAISFGGVSFVALYFYEKKLKEHYVLQLHQSEEEQPLYSGPANKLNGETVIRGVLFLFSDHLLFRPHDQSVEKERVFLQDIHDASFSSRLGFLNNCLEVKGTNKKTYRYVVREKEAWRDEIDNAMLKDAF